MINLRGHQGGKKRKQISNVEAISGAKTNHSVLLRLDKLVNPSLRSCTKVSQKLGLDHKQVLLHSALPGGSRPREEKNIAWVKQSVQRFGTICLAVWIQASMTASQ